ncbi:MAG: dUTP diphosphatase [Candidatus Magasanikbacteria bacterium]|nr:dUTP diphosphatase [Candidatus Magasanikbacteria bacterium]
MKVQIKLIDDTLPLPEYQTSGAVAFDLYSRIDLEIPAKSIAKIPTNLIVQTPPGYLLSIVTRSSTASKKGLSLLQGYGIIDQDYCGPTDEILYQVYNFTDAPVTIERGERVGQAAFLRVDQAEWEQVPEMTRPNRGGFGTTGK